MGAPIRIVVVDDHPLFRRGLITLLEGAGMKVVGTASSVLETIERGVRLRPDVVLMDLELKDGSGILATRRLLDAVGGGVKVVMLSESHDPQVMLAAVRAGAVGYLTKDQAPDRLAEAIVGVVGGEAAVSRRMVSYLLDEVRGAEQRLELAPRPPAAREADPPPARDPAADRQRLHHRADRRRAVPVARDGALARQGDPAQAQRPHASRSRRGPPPGRHTA